MISFNMIHPVVFVVLKYRRSMLSDTTLECIYTNTLPVSVHYNHHQAFITKFKKKSIFCNIQCLFSVFSRAIVINYTN